MSPHAIHPNRPRPGLVSVLSVFSVLYAACAFAAQRPELPPVTDLTSNPRLPGKFIWADLATDDAAAARTFYSRLLGWQFRDFGGYAIAYNDSRPLCGIFQKPRPKDQPDAKPRWIGFISVSNVKRAQDQATRLGGRVLASAAPFPKRGEQAILADPEGALFGVLRTTAGDPEDFLPEPGDWIWAQHLSRNARQAADFYKAIAGYEILENTESNRVSDFVLASKGYARATVRSLPAKASQVRPTWLPFVRVKSVAESVAAAQQLGGKTLIPPRPDLHQGRVAVIADPTGAAIGLLEWIPVRMEGAR